MKQRGMQIEKEWAFKVLQKHNRDYEVLVINHIAYGDTFALLTFNCELAQAYALWARKHNPDLLCVGYTNGMIGYICTAEQIREGGYEPSGSSLYFELAGTYSSSIEEMICYEVAQLVGRRA